MSAPLVAPSFGLPGLLMTLLVEVRFSASSPKSQNHEHHEAPACVTGSSVGASLRRKCALLWVSFCCAGLSFSGMRWCVRLRRQACRWSCVAISLSAVDTPASLRDGTPPKQASQEVLQEILLAKSDHAKYQDRCDQLLEELAVIKAEIEELRKKSRWRKPSLALQNSAELQQLGRRSMIPGQPLLDAAEVRASLIEKAPYTERCEQAKLRLKRAEADLAGKIAENQRLLIENAALNGALQYVGTPSSQFSSEAGQRREKWFCKIGYGMCGDERSRSR